MKKVFLTYIDRDVFNIHEITHDSSLESVSIAIKKTKDFKCKIIWGGETSSDSIKIVKLLKSPEVLFITPTASSDQIKKNHNNTIYMSMSDEHVIDSLYEELKTKKGGISIVRNYSYPNASNISSVLFRRLLLLGKDVEIINILKGDKSQINQISKSNIHIVIPSYEKDLVVVHNYLPRNNKRIYYGGDGWGSNTNIFRKFAMNDTFFRAIKLDYWDRNTCKKNVFKQVCLESVNILNHEFDSFAAIAYDSAIYLNHMFSNKELKVNFMTLKLNTLGQMLKQRHFYLIDYKSVKYREIIER